MYFKKIYMHGFKSFADPVTVEFHKGITCIVGPNGSGKSNISDAIRWVLGEQSPKMLRGGRMEEVIFSGTASRKSRGMAEVTLTIDNSTGILPIEYNEVAITRRMYRSGESEYSINNNQCRLRDIRELIMDTGIGVDGYSLIGQGKISDIVSNKTESRREIFEEAAGIVMYRTRKAEAVRKLASASGNLDRVNDIINEIEGRIDTLKEDSIKAEEYLKLREKFKELEINITLKNVENIEEKITELKNELSEIDRSSADIREKREGLEKKEQEHRVRIGALDQIGEESRQRLIQVIDEINSLVNKQEVAKERLLAMERDKERIENEISDFEARLESEKENGRVLDERLKQGRDELSVKRDILRSVIDEYTVKTEKLQNSLEEIDSRKNDLFTLTGKAQAKKTEAEGLERIIDNLESRKAQIEEEKKGEDRDKQGAEKAFDTAVKEASDIEVKLNEAEKRKENAKSSEEELVKIEKNKAKEIEELKLKIGQTISRKKTIEEMESNYEGYNYAVKFIMKSGIKGIYGTAAELMNVPEGYEIAIETALGAAMQNIICTDDACAKRCVAALKEAKAGRLTFIPLESIRYTRSDRKADFGKGFLGYADSCITFDEKYRKAYEYLLGRVAVVDNMDNAIAMASKVSGLRFVTLDGETVNNAGAITGGKYKNKTANLLERKSEVRTLENSIDSMSSELEKTQEELSDIRRRLASAGNEAENAERERLDLQMKSVAARSRVELAKASILSSDEKKEKRERELSDIEDQKNKASDMISALYEEAEKATADALSSESALEDLNISYNKEKEELDEVSEKLTAARIDVTAKEKELDGAEAIYKRIREGLEGIEADIEARKKQLENIGAEKEKLLAEGGDSEAVSALSKEKEELEGRIEAALCEKNEINRTMEAVLGERTIIEEQLEALAGAKADGDIRAGKFETQLEGYKEKLWENFEISYIQAMEFRSEDFVMSKAVKENRDIKSRLNELGEVNVGAIKEYASVKERYEFLTAQKSDITEAMDSLKAIISDMDKTIKERFKESFDQVVVQFESIFRELFGGGHAQLRLDNEDNPLESNIEIIAQPPGKKLQNINLLSGGEKTMTAIALMFAVLKTKPTPFCILDEVEAALDDANIERFAKYLQNFSEIQFALVTHQKVTMEYADVLYGVTMPEQGISKLLSLKLGDKFDLD